MTTYIYPLQPVTISGGALEATQLNVLAAVDAIKVDTEAIETATEASQVSLASIAAEDFATQTTLAALDAKVTAVNTGAVVVASSALPSGAATEASLALLNAKSAGSLAPVAHDEVVTTYVGATSKINTVTYKLASATVKVLTFSYDGSDRLTGVVAT